MLSNAVAVPVISSDLVRVLTATADGFTASLNERQQHRALMDFEADERRAATGEGKARRPARHALVPASGVALRA